MIKLLRRQEAKLDWSEQTSELSRLMWSLSKKVVIVINHLHFIYKINDLIIMESLWLWK